ncbi:hypothetical protein LEP1GSC176_2141 [Leptospira kirschneri str. MMD1493]|nr:hypothetical protein LEP1GSC176_2141 [Leptospira kirschneri str. MMD1493]
MVKILFIQAESVKLNSLRIRICRFHGLFIKKNFELYHHLKNC